MKNTSPSAIFISLVILAIMAAGCRKQGEFEVSGFNPFSNFAPGDSGTLYIDVDIPADIFEGIAIPGDEFFTFSFNLKNNRKQPGRFYYKILYQNESYKFSETWDSAGKILYNPLSAENFYGSWEGLNDSLHLTQIIQPDGSFHTITDSFRIVGNPRNERLYYGKSPSDMRPTAQKINNLVNAIKNTPEWLAAVAQKATEQKRGLEEQLYLDALWVLGHETDQGDHNSRWKRNPRAGIYRFLLVVVPEEKVLQLPPNVRNLNAVKDSVFFINPFYTLLNDAKTRSLPFQVFTSQFTLNCKIVFDLSKGIYVDPLKFTNPGIDSTHFNQNCNTSESLFRQAQVEQFFHNIDKNWVLHNIPVTMDYDQLTVADYKKLVDSYTREQMRNDFISITDCPCKTVSYNESGDAIFLTNPASSGGEFRKENVGIQSRVGFTYGKITAKIKFPELLNDHNVWNGITNAFWLIYHREGDWNLRRHCENGGYIPKSEVGETDAREARSSYSEIDIEIVKASKHWPPSSYYNNIPYPVDDPDKPDDIIVTSTNWDLACRDPEKFNVGVFDVGYNGKTYLPHRWDHWYKALTMKYAINHHEVFKRDYYYYQIDWRPDCIIWRIGPDKERMIEVGYLDTSVSSIPNNQMTFVVTQEYHHSAWWPTSEFKQEYIPYPARPIVGKVLAVEIE